MTVRRHTYPEVLDRLVVAALGGVAGERHPFPPPGGPPRRHVLERPPVRQVLSVYGARDGQPHRFGPGTDWVLDDQSVVWVEGAASLPDDGTLVSVTYTVEGATPAVDDMEVGSVLRTLLETVALEVAGLYAQLQAVHDAGFLETATGRSLDQVVALLGIERILAGRAAGELEFRRADGAVGAITIPAGTRAITPDGEIAYETEDAVTLLAAQRAVRVPARDTEPGNESVPADSLTVLPAPIAGIGTVTNPAPTALTGQDEDDVRLRRRARQFLHGSERGTLGALREAVARQGVAADVLEDPAAPGFVDVTPHAAALTPETRLRLETALRDVRPAGVVVRLHDAQPPRLVHLTLRLQTGDALLLADRRAAQRGVRAAIADYFAALAVRSTASVNQIVGLVLKIDGVTDVGVLAATWTAADGTDPADVLDADGGVLAIDGSPTVLGELHIADPGVPTMVGVTVVHPAASPPVDTTATTAALDAAVAALNARNAAADPTVDRELGYALLRTLLTLPDQAGAALAEVDGGGTAPTAGEASPYRVTVVLTLATGLSTVLAADGDSYALAPFERLARDAVEVVVDG